MDNELLRMAYYALGGLAGTGTMFFALSVMTIMNRRAEEALQQGDE